MAEPTGGRSFEFPGEAPDDLLNQILNRISSVIRRDYIVGYSPVAAFIEPLQAPVLETPDHEDTT
jgi:hypothetical protein